MPHVRIELTHFEALQIYIQLDTVMEKIYLVTERTQRRALGRALDKLAVGMRLSENPYEFFRTKTKGVAR